MSNFTGHKTHELVPLVVDADDSDADATDEEGKELPECFYLDVKCGCSRCDADREEWPECTTPVQICGCDEEGATEVCPVCWSKVPSCSSVGGGGGHHHYLPRLKSWELTPEQLTCLREQEANGKIVVRDVSGGLHKGPVFI